MERRRSIRLGPRDRGRGRDFGRRALLQARQDGAVTLRRDGRLSHPVGRLCRCGRAGSKAVTRRTWPERRTSIFSMRGECRGIIRSTPMPKEILRTVNILDRPCPLMRITVPSKAWRRSDSPSTIFRVTRT